MKRFTLGQRVLVKWDATGTAIQIRGVVARLRRNDHEAWVRLEERHERCPFPADDATRSTHILAFPDGCDRVPFVTRKGAP